MDTSDRNPITWTTFEIWDSDLCERVQDENTYRNAQRWRLDANGRGDLFPNPNDAVTKAIGFRTERGIQADWHETNQLTKPRLSRQRSWLERIRRANAGQYQRVVVNRAGGTFRYVDFPRNCVRDLRENKQTKTFEKRSAPCGGTRRKDAFPIRSRVVVVT